MTVGTPGHRDSGDAVHLLGFREGTRLEDPCDGSLLVVSDQVGIRVPHPAPGVRAVLRVLAGQGGSEEELVRLARDEDGDAEALLGDLDLAGVLAHEIFAGVDPIARLVWWGAADFPRRRPRIESDDRPLVLSRFAFARRDGETVVLETPLAPARIELAHPGAAALLPVLARPTSARRAAELAGARSSPDLARLVLALLVAAGFVEEPGAEPRSLESWEFHDLLFFSRSRPGRTPAPCGATLRYLGRVEPPPAVKPAMSGPRIALGRPDIERLEEDDPPFTLVLERRASVRRYGDPLTVERLGEFLYRSARVKGISTEDVFETSSRPYPGAGGVHELEIYVAAGLCRGLDPGLYHYHPLEHALERLEAPVEAAGRLLAQARAVAGLEGPAHALLVISARFGRMAWKYQSIAHHLVLQDVGVLYQTMYLVATAMDLAPCALGGGDSDLFARAAGLDYYEETSVGEFLLGTKPTGPP